MSRFRLCPFSAAFPMSKIPVREGYTVPASVRDAALSIWNNCPAGMHCTIRAVPYVERHVHHIENNYSFDGFRFFRYFYDRRGIKWEAEYYMDGETPPRFPASDDGLQDPDLTFSEWMSQSYD